MFKSLAEDTRLMYCGCSGDGAGGDAACGSGDGGGDGGGGDSGDSSDTGFDAEGWSSDMDAYSSEFSDAMDSLGTDDSSSSMPVGYESALATAQAQTAETAEALGYTEHGSFGQPSVTSYEGVRESAREAMNETVDAYIANNFQTPQDMMNAGLPENVQAIHDEAMKDGMVTQEEQAAYMSALDQAFPAGTAPVSEVDAVNDGSPGLDPQGSLPYANTIANAYMRTQQQNFDRINQDVKGLLSDRPMTKLGTGQFMGMPQDVYSNVQGAYIDSQGRYSTDPSGGRYGSEVGDISYGLDQSTGGGIDTIIQPDFTQPLVEEIPEQTRSHIYDRPYLQPQARQPVQKQQPNVNRIFATPSAGRR